MAKIIYHDLEDAQPSTVFHGVQFAHRVPVEVDHEDSNNDALIDAAVHNKFFEVQGLPDHEQLMEARKKRGPNGRPKKVEIEAAKKSENERAAREKKQAADTKLAADKEKADDDRKAQEAAAAAKAQASQQPQPVAAPQPSPQS